MAKPRDNIIQQALQNWAELNALKNDMTEEEISIALEHEKEYHKRQSFLFSLHQRYCTMRKERERMEIWEILDESSNS